VWTTVSPRVRRGTCIGGRLTKRRRIPCQRRADSSTITCCHPVRMREELYRLMCARQTSARCSGVSACMILAPYTPPEYPSTLSATASQFFGRQPRDPCARRVLDAGRGPAREQYRFSRQRQSKHHKTHEDTTTSLRRHTPVPSVGQTSRRIGRCGGMSCTGVAANLRYGLRVSTSCPLSRRTTRSHAAASTIVRHDPDVC
jgi:hypothetical protein